MEVVQNEDLPSLTVVNVVITYSIGMSSVDLLKLSLYNRHGPGKYDMKSFAAITFNLEAPGSYKTVALMFPSGNIVHTGSRTTDDAIYHAWGFIAWLNQYYSLKSLRRSAI